MADDGDDTSLKDLVFLAFKVQVGVAIIVILLVTGTLVYTTYIRTGCDIRTTPVAVNGPAIETVDTGGYAYNPSRRRPVSGLLRIHAGSRFTAIRVTGPDGQTVHTGRFPNGTDTATVPPVRRADACLTVEVTLTAGNRSSTYRVRGGFQVASWP
ncbi:MAG: hypothetical protein ABEK12_00445 [Candidatus Nanohaloarchaea archaeon]